MTKVDHYLLGIQVFANFYMHGYVMCLPRESQEALTRVTNTMINTAEKLCEEADSMLLPIILTTKLDEPTTKLVRRVIDDVSPDEVRSTLAKATDFHFSVWLMSTTDEDSQRLWSLH